VLIGAEGFAAESFALFLELLEQLPFPGDERHGAAVRGTRRVFLSHTSELREIPARMPYVEAAAEAVVAAGHAVADMAHFPAADRPRPRCAVRLSSPRTCSC
jgi:hypothetical protein